MNDSDFPSSVEKQERAIESKEALLAYLRGNPKRMTIESFVCLAGLLAKAGWLKEGDRWNKDGLSLTVIAAAEQELDRQIRTDKDHLLRQTVSHYRPPDG